MKQPDSFGRVDLLAFRLAERGVRAIEQYYGTPGLWDQLESMAEYIIAETLPDEPVFKPKRRLCS